MIIIDFNPFKDFGSLIFLFKKTTKYPAIKPASIPPKNPAPIELAINPPIIPGAKADLSPIE